MSRTMVNGFSVQELKDWASTYRMAYRKGTLSRPTIQILEALPGWYWHKTRFTKTPQEWVPVAEKLAAEQPDGVLPHPRLLHKLGFAQVYNALRKRPELFAHIPQAKVITFLTPEQWAEKALQFAAQQPDGKLPAGNWAIRSLGAGLPYNMRKFPKAFAHVPRRTQLEQLVMDAERIAAQQPDGKIPLKGCCPVGHIPSGLRLALKAHPKMFAHIPQHKKQLKTKKPAEWVVIAEELAAKQKDGYLPPNGELPGGLLTAKYVHPELYAHIPQRKPDVDQFGKRMAADALAKNLAIYPELVAQCGGRPTSTWLQNHGHGQLYKRRFSNPEPFEAIENGWEEGRVIALVAAGTKKCPLTLPEIDDRLRYARGILRKALLERRKALYVQVEPSSTQSMGHAASK
jgi:hypothetical protein